MSAVGDAPADPEPALHAAPDSWIAALRAIISLVESSDVRELEVRWGTMRISLQRTAVLPYPAPDVGPRLSDPGLHPVRSPLTGLWYDAPAPGAPPFVHEGNLVDVGYVIGLVETMKVFNEVTSDVAGIVRQILVRRGELVQAGAPVLWVELVEPLPTGPGQ